VTLSAYVNTLGQKLLKQYGSRVHKLAINAGFTCPNRDGSKGRGGCTFCNNASFNPNTRQPLSVTTQIANGRKVMAKPKRTGAKLFIAYFQAYTNTYADIEYLSKRYEEALAEPDVIGLSVGTRPDCISDEILALLASYKKQGYEIWLELGLQSAFDKTLLTVQRGHTFADYRSAVKMTQKYGIPICTHLIIGLPDEERQHHLTTLARVLELGTNGLKLHPLHVVKHTFLAKQWQLGLYQPLALKNYVSIVADLIERTPADIVYHRVTGTASLDVLLAPMWCNKKWAVLNAIEAELRQRNSGQGKRVVDQQFSLWM